MTDKQKKELIRILLSALMLLVCLFLPQHISPWLKALCCAAPLLLCGGSVLLDAFKNLLHGQLFDEKFLMTLAAVCAFCLGEYPEGAAIMLFWRIGEWFEGIAVGRSRKNIADLMNLCPDTATVLREGTEITVSPEEVEIGERILVRPGEKIPIDGMVVSGRSSLNTAALTGESAPQEAAPGSAVCSGTVNMTSALEIETRKRYEDSTVSRILEMVETATDKKAPVEHFITKFARVYTPAVVAGAALLALLPPLFFSAAWNEWIHRALIFLVVSCPCALVVSVPLTFFAGIGSASRQGILIKGSDCMENLAGVKTAVFDKTGTLTQGSFTVTEVFPNGVTRRELLSLAALAEAHSTHPIALSILAACGAEPDTSRLGAVREIAGMGIEAEVDHTRVYAGNLRLMRSVGITPPEESERGTAVYLAREKEYLGCIVIADTVKPEAKEALRALKADGVEKLVMLTGDRPAAARQVSAQLGMDETAAQLLPQDKVIEVEKRLMKGRPLCFTGDGINDAPVLIAADVGIAMGLHGTDAAIEAADVVLMNDDLSLLPRAKRLAAKTMRIVRQNIVLSLALKAAVLVLGALGIAQIGLAIFADVGVLILAVLNAMRAMKA